MNTFTKIAIFAAVSFLLSPLDALAGSANQLTDNSGTYRKPIRFELLSEQQPRVNTQRAAAPISRDIPLSAPTATKTSRIIPSTVSSTAAEASTFRHVQPIRTNSLGMVIPFDDDFD